jgi:hypothetical protein
MLSVSGLPLKYFTIFNSMEQKYSCVKTETFNPADIDRLSISTTHTDIRLRPGNTNEITVAYQQVDWLDCDIGLNGKTLYFTEESNDTLPLFQLVQMHRNSAELTITIPIGFKPFAIDLESYGGYVYIDGISSDIDVKTTTGSIFIKPNASAPANIEATTENGRLETDPLNGTPIGSKTAKGREYTENNGSDDTIEANSSNGGIYISRISQ